MQKRRLVGIFSAFVFAFTFTLFATMEQKLIIPVVGATVDDWHQDSFWYNPWGPSGVHKGIDIFAKKGVSVVSAASGLVVSKGDRKLGGKVIAVLGPQWKLHYYAHLDSINVRLGELVKQGQHIATVGNTGNAAGKLPHLHYSIVSLVPRVSQRSSETQGWKRVFYLDPGLELGY